MGIALLAAGLGWQATSWATDALTFEIAVSLATPTPTPFGTPTFTPTPTSTPFMEHFNQPSGTTGGWFINYNAVITSNGLGSARVVSGTLLSTNIWGRVDSNTMTLDVGYHNTLRVVITGVDASTGNKLILHDVPNNTDVLIDQGMGVGVHEYNIQTATAASPSGSWTGLKQFYISLIVETGSTQGVGTQFDEIWIYPSGSFTVQEDFRIAGNPPSGWFDETNADVNANGTDSMLLSSQTANNPPYNWCSATSNTNTIDLNTYGMLSVVITNVDANTGNVIYLHNVTDNVETQIDANLGVGVHNYDIKSITGWSGTKNIYLRLEAETGTLTGVGTRFDEICIGAYGQ